MTEVNWYTKLNLKKKKKEKVKLRFTDLVGMTTVIGTLNRGPALGVAVSYPHTWQNKIQPLKIFGQNEITGDNIEPRDLVAGCFELSEIKLYIENKLVIYFHVYTFIF